ncbi:hypothetical protein Bhyg_04969, partial [Pseudolycoriella hygida]
FVTINWHQQPDTNQSKCDGNASLTGAETMFSCGGYLTATRGIIETPNFPNKFHVPINCLWIIDGSASDKTNISIVVYFTQQYVLSGLKFTEYLYYTEDYKVPSQQPSFVWNEDAVTQVSWIQFQSPYLEIKFTMANLHGTHLRSLNRLLDVYGFNITYEIDDVKPYQCSALQCRFSGNCYVKQDFSKFCSPERIRIRLNENFSRTTSLKKGNAAPFTLIHYKVVLRFSFIYFLKRNYKKVKYVSEFLLNRNTIRWVNSIRLNLEIILFQIHHSCKLLLLKILYLKNETLLNDLYPTRSNSKKKLESHCVELNNMTYVPEQNFLFAKVFDLIRQLSNTMYFLLFQTLIWRSTRVIIVWKIFYLTSVKEFYPNSLRTMCCVLIPTSVYITLNFNVIADFFMHSSFLCMEFVLPYINSKSCTTNKF